MMIKSQKFFVCMLGIIICTYGKVFAQKQPSTEATMLSRRVSNPTPLDLSLRITILYFDQSSPKLRPGVKAMLDTLARQLVDQPALMATVTGYTDDVGNRELNLLLAEHRAKAVENYLKQHRVRAEQIVAQWEGPDTKASTNDPVKTIGRRVVIQLLPK